MTVKPVRIPVKVSYGDNQEAQKAKLVLIEDLYDDKLTKVGKILRGRCPFHNDHGNPNFVIYPDTNSWYCFRCGDGGDSISFFMLLNKVGFREAIKELLGK